MSRLIAVFGLCPLMALGQVSAPKQDWIQLFNGKDLSNWTVKITGQDLPADGNAWQAWLDKGAKR